MKKVFYLAFVSLILILTSCENVKSSNNVENPLLNEHIHQPSNPIIENVVDATCDKDGSYDEVVYCSSLDCNAEISRTSKTIPMLGHDYDHVDNICKKCGDMIIDVIEYEPGLYDENSNLIVSWDELTNKYGLDVEKDYNDLNETTRLACIIENNDSLSNGSILVIDDSVERIGDYALCKCTSLKSVIIFDGVTSIGICAFGDCESLSSVQIPGSVTSIGAGAFGYCTFLESIIIPNGVQSIGEGAFVCCRSLKNVFIPKTVVTIDAVVFLCCPINNITVEIDNPNYKSIEGNLYDKDGTTLIKYAAGKTNAEFSVPNGVIHISGGAFRGSSSLVSVEIPYSVSSIGEDAFTECDSLEGVYITNIDKWCEIVFESSDSNPIVYAHNIYLNGELVTHLVVPNGVTNIKYLFSGWSSLVSVVIPEGVSVIDNNTFSNCTSLTSVVIPKSVTSINKCAFSNCYSLMSIEIPDGVQSIDEKAFLNCKSLTSVIISNSVNSIHGSAFSECRAITDVYYAGDAERWIEINDVRHVSYFLGNANIHYNYIPE
jgi:hypothetical protein